MNDEKRRLNLPQEEEQAKEEKPAPSSLLEELKNLAPISDLEIPEHSEIISLPSEGEFYPPGHPLEGKGTIELKHPTLKEQNILNKKSLIKEGVAFDRCLQLLIADRRLRVEDLLLGDREKLLLEMRKMMRGEEYQAKVICPKCGTESVVTCNMSSCIHDHVPTAEKLREVGVEIRDRGGIKTFLTRLPATGYIAEFRLLTVKDEKEMLEQQKAQQKLVKMNRVRKGEEEELQIKVRKMLVSVQGCSDASVLNRFVQRMPTPDPEVLIEAYEAAEPTSRMTMNFKCEEPLCEFEEPELPVPIDINFFWGRRRMRP